MSTKPTRIITPFPHALLRAVDDYRFAKRLDSRAEAIRQLTQKGLDAERGENASTAASGVNDPKPE